MPNSHSLPRPLPINPLLLDLSTRIDTARLTLRPPQPGDGALLQAALAESQQAMRAFLHFLPWVAAEPTLEMAELRCRQAHAAFAARTDLPWFVFEQSSGRLVGSVGLHRSDWAVPKTEVGYWVRSSATGLGYASEAVRGLTEQVAFGVIGAQRVELITDAANTASRRVAERCGFTLEAVQRASQRGADASLRDTCVYARWPQPA